jgi:hypothetical protein
MPAPARPAIRLADVELFPLGWGVNRIADFAGDGRDGLVVAGWRDNGNAHGFTVFMVLAGDGEGVNNVVTFPPDDATTIADAPHTGEDYVRSVRFGRGRLDGRSETLAFVATRQIEGPYPDPARTVIQVLALRERHEGFGPLFFFAEQARFETGRRYCNAEIALRAELGLPPRPEAIGPDTPDGC